MLPIGLSDMPGEAMVKLYCPKCQEIYNPKSSRHHHTDGAYFGTGFPVSCYGLIPGLKCLLFQHMLFMVHPEYRPKRPTSQFVARLYGFKIHPMAYQLQQVSWEWRWSESPPTFTRLFKHDRMWPETNEYYSGGKTETEGFCSTK